MGPGGVGGAVEFLSVCPSVESINIKKPIKLLGGPGGKGRHYDVVTLKNSMTRGIISTIPEVGPYIAAILDPLELLNELFGFGLPTLGDLLENFAMFVWSAPVVGDYSYAAPGAINMFEGMETKLKSITLAADENEDIFKGLFYNSVATTVKIVGKALSKNAQHSLPKYLNGSSSSVVGAVTLDLRDMEDLPVSINLRMLNPVFKTIKLPAAIKYIAKTGQTIEGGVAFSVSDNSIFLDNTDGEGLADLRFLDGVVNASTVLYAPLSISCYLAPIEFTLPPKVGVTFDADYMYRHSNGSTYTRKAKRVNIQEDGTLDLSDVGITSSRTMRLESVEGIKKVLLPEQILNLGLPSSAEELTAHIRLRSVSGTDKLKKIQLKGDISYGEPESIMTLIGGITLSLSGGAWPPPYLLDARLTADDATLDLSGVPNLPYELDLTLLNSNITKVVLNPEILQGTKHAEGLYVQRLDANMSAINYNSGTEAIYIASSDRETKVRRVIRNIGGALVSEGPLLSTEVIKAFTSLKFLEGAPSLKRVELEGSANSNENFLPGWVNGVTVLDLTKVIDLPALTFSVENVAGGLVLPAETRDIVIDSTTLEKLTAHNPIFLDSNYERKRIRYLTLLGESVTLGDQLHKGFFGNTIYKTLAVGDAENDSFCTLDISQMSALPTTLNLSDLIEPFNVIALPFQVVDVVLPKTIWGVTVLSQKAERITASLSAIHRLAEYALVPEAVDEYENFLNKRDVLSEMAVVAGDDSTVIEDNFLRGVEHLDQIDLTNIAEQVSSVGVNFLSDSSGVKICLSVGVTPSGALLNAFNTLSGQTIKLLGSAAAIPGWLNDSANVPATCALDLTEASLTCPIINLKDLAGDVAQIKLTDGGFYYEVDADLSEEDALFAMIGSLDAIVEQAPAHHKTKVRAILSNTTNLQSKIAASNIVGDFRRVGLVSPTEGLQNAYYIKAPGQVVEGGVEAEIPDQAVVGGVLDLSAEVLLGTHLDLTTKDATTVKLPANTVAAILHENVTTVEFGGSLVSLSWLRAHSVIKNISLISAAATSIPQLSNPAGLNLNVGGMTNLPNIFDPATLGEDIIKITLPAQVSTITLEDGAEPGDFSFVWNMLSRIDESTAENITLDLTALTWPTEGEIDYNPSNFLVLLPHCAAELIPPQYSGEFVLPAHFTRIELDGRYHSLENVTLGTGHPKLSEIRLNYFWQDSATVTKALDNTMTQQGFKLDLSGVSISNDVFDASNSLRLGEIILPSGVEGLVANANLVTIRLVDDHPGLSSIQIEGSAAGALPDWATDEALLQDAATLDFSNVLGLSAALDFSTLNDSVGLVLPSYVNELSLPVLLENFSFGVGHSGLSRLTLAGDASSQTVINQIQKLAANATLDISAVTTAAPELELDLPGNFSLQLLIVSSSTPKVTTSSPRTINTVRLIDDITEIPEYIASGVLFNNAILDLSAATNLPSPLDLRSLASNINSVTLPASVNSIIAADTLELQLVDGHAGLSSVVFEGSDSDIRGWLTDGSFTAENAVLDLSGMTGLGASIDLRVLHTNITTVKVPSTVTSVTVPNTLSALQLATGHAGLTTIALAGSSTTVPVWAKDGAITQAGSTLDLSGMTGFGTSIDLTALSLHSDITTVKVPSTVTSVTVPNTLSALQIATGHAGLTTIALTGDAATIPLWARDGSLMQPGSTLDLKLMLNFSSPYTVPDLDDAITQLMLPVDAQTYSLGNANSGIVVTIAGYNNILLDASYSLDATLPLYLNDDEQVAPYSCLDLSNMTALSLPLDLTALSNNIVIVKLPAYITGVRTKGKEGLLQLALDHLGLETIIIADVIEAAPSWATDGSLTAGNATLDLSEMTGLDATVDLSGLSSDVTTLILPEIARTVTAPNTVTTLTVSASAQISGVSALARINLTGNAASAPAWATDGSLTINSAVLDLSGMTGLGASIDLAALPLHADIATVKVPTSVTDVILPASVLTLALAAGHPGLNVLKVVGEQVAVPGWLTDGSIFASGATLDISELVSPQIILDNANVTQLITSPDAPSVLGGPSDRIELLKLVGTFPDVSGFMNGIDWADNAMLDLSAVTQAPQSYDFTAVHPNFSVVKLPSDMTEITVLPSLRPVLYQDKLSKITLNEVDSESAAAIPGWATSGDILNQGAALEINLVNAVSVLDLSIVTVDDLRVEIGAGLSSGVLRINSNVAMVVSSVDFGEIVLSGSAASVPAWARDGSLTNADAILTLSEMTGLGEIINLTMPALHSDIVRVVLPDTITAITAPSTLEIFSLGTLLEGVLNFIALTGGASYVPMWANDPGMTAANTELSLAGVTGFGASFNFNMITNGEITRVVLPVGVLALGTSGWTNMGGTVWERQ